MVTIAQVKKIQERLNALCEEQIGKNGEVIHPFTSRTNIEIANEYIDDLLINGVIAKSSICTRIDDLIFVFKNTDIELSNLTERDIKTYLMALTHYTYCRGGKEKPLAESTKITRKMHFKDLLKYLKEDELNSMIKIKASKTNNKLPEDLLTHDDIEVLIKASNHPRHKAMVASVYEAGSRAKEILSCKLKHVEFDDEGFVHILFPKGKTGARKILLVYAASYLRQWIDVHPLKDDPEAPLWVTLDKNLKPLKYMGFYSILTGLAEKAGIKKKTNPHSFRHARATHLAHHMTEQQMKVYLGWVPGSNMTATYVHLAGKDTDGAVLNMYGIKKQEEKPDATMPVKCPRCKEYNPQNAAFCYKCGYGLDDNANKDKNATMAEMMKIMMQSPEIQELFNSKMAQMQQ